jgi:Ca-activated chloride channel family protein
VLQRRRCRYVVRFSNTALLASVAPKRAGWRRHVAFGLLLLSLGVLTLGLAQPTAAVHVARDRAVVMLALDVSPSMQATDVLPTRIEASEAGAQLFAQLLPPAINLGLVSFGGQANLDVAPTVDRAAVRRAINGLSLVDSTAIGEAVFTSLDALQSFAQTMKVSGAAPLPARIVLMSDGSNNKGRSVTMAAAAAKAAGVPVSTIAFGTDSGTVTIGGETVPVPADKATLQALAQETGGTYRSAASAAELRSVYSDLGTQIGYTTTHKVVSWNFLATGLLLAVAAAATSLLWAERLV